MGAAVQQSSPLVVYVDVDDTPIRTAGSKIIPVSGVKEHVAALASQGAAIYCWSSGGTEYARNIAERLAIAHCFVGFLPKPHVILDDQPPENWRRTTHILPGLCGAMTADAYWQEINAPRA
ncbi:MAG: hydrolase [Pirellulales bacterium]